MLLRHFVPSSFSIQQPRHYNVQSCADTCSLQIDQEKKVFYLATSYCDKKQNQNSHAHLFVTIVLLVWIKLTNINDQVKLLEILWQMGPCPYSKTYFRQPSDAVAFIQRFQHSWLSILSECIISYHSRQLI